MHKELAEWTHPNSCSKWFNVQMEPGNEWCSSGVHTDTNAFQNPHQRHGQTDLAAASASMQITQSGAGTAGKFEQRDDIRWTWAGLKRETTRPLRS